MTTNAHSDATGTGYWSIYSKEKEEEEEEKEEEEERGKCGGAVVYLFFVLSGYRSCYSKGRKAKK